MYPDQLVSGQLIQIYTVFKTSYTQVQHGMGHFTLFTGHHISLIFWGELIDKYKDINANSKTVFTDYAMLKLVLYSPHMFLLFCQSKVDVVKKNSGAKCFI